MPATQYLKNAWANKDADGSYWLFIQSDDLQAMFRLDFGASNACASAARPRVFSE